jgi:hypothetical protein
MIWLTQLHDGPRDGGPWDVGLVEGECDAEGHVESWGVIGMTARVPVEWFLVKSTAPRLTPKGWDAVFREAALDPG